MQERRRGAGIADRGAQVGQYLAQIMSRRCIGQFGPQQRGQRVAVVRPLGLEREIGEQGARLVIGEATDRLPTCGDLHWPEQCKR